MCQSKSHPKLGLLIVLQWKMSLDANKYVNRVEHDKAYISLSIARWRLTDCDFSTRSHLWIISSLSIVIGSLIHSMSMTISFADRIEVNVVVGIFSVFSLYASVEFLRSFQRSFTANPWNDDWYRWNVPWKNNIKRWRIQWINRLMYQLNVQLSRNSDARLSY